MSAAVSLLAAPDDAELRRRIVAHLRERGTLAGLNGDSVAEFTADVRRALVRERAERSYDPREWELLTRLGVDYAAHERALVTYTDALASQATAATVSEAVSTVAAQRGWRVALLTTDRPFAAVWDAGPGSWLRLMCPASCSDTRVQLGGIRIPSGGEAPTEPGWKPLRRGRRTLGWARGNRLVSAVHPFLTADGRLTASSLARREAALVELFELAAEHLDVFSDLGPDPVASWSHARQVASWLSSLAQEASRPMLAAADELVAAEAQAQASVDELRAQLQAAEARLNVASANASEAEPLREAAVLRASRQMDALYAQAEALSALPAVADACVVPPGRPAAGVQVTTVPLVLDCGRDGLRHVEPVRFVLNPFEGADPTFIAGSDGASPHPAVTVGLELDCSAVAVPLAQALGAGDLRAAASVLCGLLARPLARLPRNRSGFRRAADGSRPGWQSA